MWQLSKRDDCPQIDYSRPLSSGLFLCYLRPMRQEISNLPQSQMYLTVANWGIDSMVSERPLGTAFRFHVVGILASLRAVQHALMNHDSTLSDKHRELVSAWKKNTPMDGFEINFITTSRNDSLKGGFFDAYAIKGESGTGSGGNYVITEERYDTFYDKDGETRDLIADMQSSAKWCKKQLASISAQLPKMYAPD